MRARALLEHEPHWSASECGEVVTEGVLEEAFVAEVDQGGVVHKEDKGGDCRLRLCGKANLELLRAWKTQLTIRPTKQPCL